MGGIGKSTLAAALAHDSGVQARFPDGVLWATLGQEPDLLNLLSGWAQSLDDTNFKPFSVATVSRYLQELLHDKAALLVVDDVWERAPVPSLLAGAPRRRFLITPRRFSVTSEVGADLFQLDVLTPDQSLALLTAHLGRDIGPA